MPMPITNNIIHIQVKSIIRNHVSHAAVAVAPTIQSPPNINVYAYV